MLPARQSLKWCSIKTNELTDSTYPIDVAEAFLRVACVFDYADDYIISFRLVPCRSSLRTISPARCDLPSVAVLLREHRLFAAACRRTFRDARAHRFDQIVIYTDCSAIATFR